MGVLCVRGHRGLAEADPGDTSEASFPHWRLVYVSRAVGWKKKIPSEALGALFSVLAVLFSAPAAFAASAFFFFFFKVG